MSGYLDNNIYMGAGNASQQMGDAFTRAIVGTAALQRQRELQAQQALFESQRIALEQQRLNQQAPLIQAQTAYNQSGADLDTQKLKDLQTSAQAGGMLGDVMKGIGETDVLKNPQTMQFLQAIAAQQQARLAAQHPQNIAQQTAQIQLGLTPQGRQDVVMGYPPNPPRASLPPEQQALLSLLRPVVQASVAPETDTDLLGRKTTTRDVQSGLDLANIIARGMYPGSTNLPPRIQMPEQQPSESAATSVPRVSRLTATNPKTKQRIVSDDGGQTWQPLQ